MEYNYVAQEDDELTLRKGDIITGIKVMLGGWWEGTLRDKRGMFPDNFVKVSNTKSTRLSFIECDFFFILFIVISTCCLNRCWILRQPAMEATAAATATL